MNNLIIQENPLRKLARNYYYQVLYNRSKELNFIKLFENDRDFTHIQILFLQYLEIISQLYIDLLMGENLLCEEVISDWVRSEAYLLYKRRKKEEEKLKGIDKVSRNQSSDRIVFISRDKRK